MKRVGNDCVFEGVLISSAPSGYSDVCKGWYIRRDVEKDILKQALESDCVLALNIL